MVSDCNRYAFEWLENWTFKVQSNFVCLVGESGSGKSHLARIWAEKTGAEFLSRHRLAEVWQWGAEFPNRFCVLDDADELNDDLLLFYIYNTIKERNGYLLMTAKTYPNDWKLKYEDIKSRLRTVDVITVQRPNEQAVSAILEQMLLQRGLVGTPEIIEYIANRIERTYEAMRCVVNRIDSYQMGKKGKLNMQAIRAIFK